MKSQLMTALSIVGVLGTATTAMAVNTDALATLDSGNVANATDALLPAPASTDAAAPTATPAPVDPTVAPAEPTVAPQPNTSSPARPGQSGSGGSAPAVQSPQAPVVNGTSGGSGTRVAPAAGVTTPQGEDHEDGDRDVEHEGEDDD